MIDAFGITHFGDFCYDIGPVGYVAFVIQRQTFNDCANLWRERKKVIIKTRTPIK